MAEGLLSPSEVKFWINEIHSCVERQRKELMIRNSYPLLIKYYEGDQVNQAEGDDDEKKMAIINEYFPNVNNLIAQILFSNPEILVNASKPSAILNGNEVDVVQNEPTMKGALDYAYDKLGMQVENKLGLFDMIIGGYSGIEVVHRLESKDGDDENDGKEKPGLIKQILGRTKKAKDEKEAEANLEKELPDHDEGLEARTSTIVRRWDLFNIPLDWKANRLQDLRYQPKIIRYTVEEFNAKYPEFKDKVSPTSSLAHSKFQDDKNSKTIEVFEIQIKKRRGIYETIVIAPSFDRHEIDRFIRPYITNGFDIKIGTLHKYGVLYPKSMGKINKGVQDDINNYVSHIMEVAERNIPKRGVNNNKVVQGTIEALNSKMVNEVVPVNGGKDSIWEIPSTSVSPENKELLALFDQQKSKLWAVSESRAGQGSKKEFATEIQIQEQGFQDRIVDIQEGVRLFIGEQVDTVKDIIAQFWDQELYFKITGGPEPTWYQSELDADGNTNNPLTDILTLDYEIKIDIASALRPNSAAERVRLVELLTLLTGPNVAAILQLQGQQINIEFIKSIVKKFNLNPSNVFTAIQLPAPGGEEALPGELPGILGSSPSSEIPGSPLGV